MNRTMPFVLVVVFAVATRVGAGVPESICVQGYLQTLEGENVDGPVDFCAAVFDALSGGNQVWPAAGCHVLPAVPVESGLFALTFGDIDLTPEVFGNVGNGPTSGPAARWLEISTGGESMLPRIELRTAPYAFRVGFVDNPELTDAVELGSGTVLTPGDMKFFNGQSASPTITLDGNGNAGGGTMRLLNNAGSLAVQVITDPGDGNPEIHLVDQDGITTVELDARAGVARAGLTLTKAAGEPTIRLRAAHFGGENPEAGGLIIVERGPTPSGQIIMAAGWDGAKTTPAIILSNDGGATTVRLEGASPAGGGRIGVGNEAGGTLIFLEGETGKITAQTVCAPKLHGTVIAKGCDVAESFELSDRDSVASGMVMVLDELRPGHLRVSDRAYDKKVAGIVSGAGGIQPGVRLGSGIGGADDLPVALSGRVYCLVHAKGHAVKIGDLLTTSDTAGHAMKVTDFARSQGAVLGKAMEPLESGKKGLILVLVGLQ